MATTAAATEQRAAYVVELLALADVLRDIAMLPAEQAMMRLGELTDRSKPVPGVDHRLTLIRRLAAEEAVRLHGGSVAATAKAAGTDRQLVHRVLKGRSDR